MNASAGSLINPFADLIVTEPRRVDATVESVNQDAVNTVVGRFTKIAEQESQTRPSILLVTSPEPGFGKSHLIGRVFRALEKKAFLIYLRAFQDPETRWCNILEKTAGELDLPERADAVACLPGELTQLDALARQLFSRCFCGAVDSTKLGSEALVDWATRFRDHPVRIFDRPDVRSGFISTFEVFLPFYAEALRASTKPLRNNAESWLSVLFHYTFAEPNARERQLSLDWLRGLPLDLKEAEAIGLRLADNVPLELPPAERDEICFRRLSDLCCLSLSYRPFLFCFDQTELYAQSNGLAHSLGTVLSRLRRELSNHLTLVTGNQDVWNSKVFPEFERADQDVIDHQLIRLRGVRKGEAKALIANRCRLFSIDEKQIQELVDNAWFDELFKTQAERSARSILKECAIRWGEAPIATLKELFRAYYHEMLSKGQRLTYDDGVFRWFVEKGLSRIPKLNVEAFHSAKGYLRLRWRLDAEVLLFCFESGSNYLRWKAIAQEATNYRQQGEAQKLSIRSVGFRLPTQRDFGQKTKEDILNRAERALFIFRPSEDMAARIFAAYELYAEVVQGNHNHVGGDEVLEFLAQEFNLEALGLLQSETTVTTQNQKKGPENLTEYIRRNVRQLRNVSWEILRIKLAERGVQAELTAVLKCCSELESEVKVFTSPTNAFFQWISSRSA
jgi:hypothetical protein